MTINDNGGGDMSSFTYVGAQTKAKGCDGQNQGDRDWWRWG
jgi:hypothetical protein